MLFVAGEEVMMGGEKFVVLCEGGGRRRRERRAWRGGRMSKVEGGGRVAGGLGDIEGWGWGSGGEVVVWEAIGVLVR